MHVPSCSLGMVTLMGSDAASSLSKSSVIVCQSLLELIDDDILLPRFALSFSWDRTASVSMVCAALGKQDFFVIFTTF